MPQSTVSSHLAYLKGAEPSPEKMDVLSPKQRKKPIGARGHCRPADLIAQDGAGRD